MLVALAEAEPRYQPMVVINWTPAALGLVRALAKVARSTSQAQAPDDQPPVVCLGTQPSAVVERALQDSSARALLRYVEVPSLVEGIEALASVLADEVRIAEARSVIVLPADDAEEPDAASRLTCAAVGRACAPKPVPNILVEVEDPEAAYEFAGLGVATVFYPGYLRAALLAHACVDLGVFQFVYGLLRGRYRVRLQPVPATLREATFLDVALGVEHDEHDRPVTPIGLQLPPEQPSADGHPALLINPGPRRSVRDALGVLVLVEA
ncbi:hypothetical protein [Paraliomyxa miuraensis]|uniref:hypothetical protein n=1 Tax=Paraliomyxa miuraensis TaxID=376150 RepID=UPI0022554ECE|nr:hypothetical protein [Paraliomyxa miuraensis]MCX4246254.1 hypothetical protein [Paraliomyxa miuraensis]